MRYLFIFFLLLTFRIYSQQEFEICELPNTFTYSTTIDINGTVSWFLNGNQIGDGLNIDITYDEPGDYQLVAIGYNDIGCPGLPVVLDIIVTQCDPLIFWVPNSFTPDGNEFNQMWGPVLTSGISLDKFELKVYNRWGALIWETQDSFAKWDGTYDGILVPDGTYVWTMVLDMIDNDGKKSITGHVTIVR
jgi:gliding motility-associated-like protein